MIRFEIIRPPHRTKPVWRPIMPPWSVWTAAICRRPAQWDGLRRAFDTWTALVHLRFAQDTTDAAAKAAREYADALAPEAADLEIALKRRLLA